jgi:hypothetical protein
VNAPHRELLEDALGVEMTSGVRTLAEATGIDPDNWHRHGFIARPYEHAATLELAARLWGEGGRTREAAEHEACRRLSVSFKTFETRARSWGRPPLEIQGTRSPDSARSSAA